MRDLIAIIAIAVALTGCVTPKPRECNPQTSNIRVRIDRDPRTDRIVSVVVLCDGRVIPQHIGSVISVPAEVRHGE